MPGQRKISILLDASRAYNRSLYTGIARYARLNGAWILDAEPTEPDDRTLPPSLALSDGVILQVRTRRQLDWLQHIQLPFVTMASVFQEENLPHVSNDGRAICRMAFEHFFERSFRHFAFCELNDISHIRSRYFVEEVQRAGFECHVFRVGYQDRRKWIGGRDHEALDAWVDSLPKPVGILALNDLRGRHLINSCQRLGISVPDDVAVLGVDNEMPHCEICNPPLSSVVPDAERIGFEAASLLDQLIDDDPPEQTRVLIPPTDIVVRQSTDVIATGDNILAQGVSFILENACNGMDVGDLLKHLIISRTALDRRFTKALGRTPHEEILRVRLKRARQLLAETKWSVEAVARKSGFVHGEYLGAVFRKLFGQTPGQFRDATHRAIPGTQDHHR